MNAAPCAKCRVVAPAPMTWREIVAAIMALEPRLLDSEALVSIGGRQGMSAPIVRVVAGGGEVVGFWAGLEIGSVRVEGVGG